MTIAIEQDLVSRLYFNGWLSVIQKWRSQLARRRRFKGLLDLDERTLLDVGLTRAGIFWGLSLPLSENASVRAHERARKNRRLAGLTGKFQFPFD